MKHTQLLLTLFAVAAFAVGRNEEQTTSQQIDKAQAETRQAAQNIQDYAYAQKADSVAKMQAQLTAPNNELDGFSAKIEKANGGAKAEAQPKLQALRGEIARLSKQLDEVGNAIVSTWDSVKGGFNKTYEASKEGFC